MEPPEKKIHLHLASEPINDENFAEEENDDEIDYFSEAQNICQEIASLASTIHLSDNLVIFI